MSLMTSESRLKMTMSVGDQQEFKPRGEKKHFMIPK